MLSELEKKRLFLVETKKYNLVIRVLGALLLLGLYLTVKVAQGYLIFIFNFIFVLTIMYYWRYYTIYRKEYKMSIINDLILQGSDNALYTPTKFVESYLFDKSRLFSRDYNSYAGEDMISFTDFGNLQLSELTVTKREERTNSDNTKTTETSTVFNGIFFVATFPFYFEGTTQLFPRSIASRFTAGENVRLESPTFMNIWDVKTTSQLGARMALGTDIMNNLLYLKESVGQNDVKVSFLDNQIFIAVNQKMFLEPNVNASVYDQTSTNVLKKQLLLITNIIQTFKLRQSKSIQKQQLQ
jgi:hypothetical protein